MRVSVPRIEALRARLAEVGAEIRKTDAFTDEYCDERITVIEYENEAEAVSAMLDAVSAAVA